MSSTPVTAADSPSPGARHLARGITATWWYTASAVVMFEAFLVGLWALVVFAESGSWSDLVVLGGGGLIWWLSTVVLLIDYRHRAEAEPGIRWGRLAVPLLVAVGYGVAAGLVADSWLLALMPLAQSIVLLNWAPGIRYRVIAALTLVLAVLAFIDGADRAEGAGPEWWMPAIYTVLIPIMTVSSLWWWDVLITLDRARASEARLAATQERLRIATDVHDLQGHHLQVIALQLELAERLLARDPDAALEQLQAARASVDEARQGTRDLAMRFRSVPLGDELANARDLLTAAGLVVEARIAADADLAPASALGPVIRETTTNVLRHGGGTRACISLDRMPDSWRYEISNDAMAGVNADREGSGLEGIGRRIAEVGGTVHVRRGDDFTVTVTVPAGEGAR